MQISAYDEGGTTPATLGIPTLEDLWVHAEHEAEYLIEDLGPCSCGAGYTATATKDYGWNFSQDEVTDAFCEALEALVKDPETGGYLDWQPHECPTES